MNKWNYNEDGLVKNGIYEKTQLIAKYENAIDMETKDRITSYFGDMDLYELLDNTTEELFEERYKESVSYFKKVSIASKICNMVINGVIKKSLYKEQKRLGAMYRFSLKSYTQEILDKLYLLGRTKLGIETFNLNTIEDWIEKGNYPAMELEVYFSDTKEYEITNIKVCYNCQYEYAEIYTFTKEEILELAPNIISFIEKYDNYLIDNTKFRYDDETYEETIPLCIRHEWYTNNKERV